MSPYLFALVMEFLLRAFNRLKDVRSFGYHPKCARTNIICLLFADDLLVFCKADPNYVKLMKERLEMFSKSSSLVANSEKSEVFLSRVDDQLQ